MMAASVVFFVIWCILLVLTGIVSLGMFVYYDARLHTDTPALWVVVVIFVPHLIGLLLYFIIGRKPAYLCSGCMAPIPQGAGYCKHCGRQADNLHPAPMPREAKTALTMFFVSLGLTIVSFVLFFVFMAMNTAF